MEIIVLIEGVHNDLGPLEGTSVINSINPICSSVTLIKEKKNIIIDTGFRGFQYEIVSRLQEQNLSCEEIDYVFNTHSHFDHCYNNYLFTNAKLIFGQSILTPKKWDVLNKIAIPDLSVIETPGHYPDHQSILVKTDKIFVIAGDAIREDIIRNEVMWNSMNSEYTASAKHILDIADVIVPGHGKTIEGKLLRELKMIIESR